MRTIARSTFFSTSLVTASWIIPTVNVDVVAMRERLTRCVGTGSGRLIALGLGVASSRDMGQVEYTSGDPRPGTPLTGERRVRRSAGISKAFRAIKAQHSANRSQMEIIADRM